MISLLALCELLFCVLLLLLVIHSAEAVFCFVFLWFDKSVGVLEVGAWTDTEKNGLVKA